MTTQTTTHVTARPAVVPPSRPSANVEDALSYANDLRRLLERSPTTSQFFSGVVELTMRQSSVVGCALWMPDAKEKHRVGPAQFREKSIAHDDAITWLLPQVEQSCAKGEFVFRRDAGRSIETLVAPLSTSDASAISILYRTTNGTETQRARVAYLQSIVAHLTTWQARRRELSANRDLNAAAVTIDLIGVVATATNLHAACCIVTEKLVDCMKARRVAIGLCTGKSLQVASISGVGDIDHHAELTKQWHTVLSETMVREELTSWPPLPGASPHQLVAHKQLSRRDAAVISVPLRDVGGDLIGVVAVEGRRELVAGDAAGLMSALSEPLGTAIQQQLRLEGGRLQRLMRWMTQQSGRLKRVAVAAMCFVVAAAMFVPVPHRISGEVVVEPVHRRFCVALHDGLLESSLVEPGTIVRRGDVLAKMDGREILWELTGLEADKQKARKEHDTHRAAHATAKAQIAELEMQRLKSRADLLRYREANLRIKSPLDGVVLAGSLDRRENFPVSKGQALFEVAPLEELLVEVNVPAEAIEHVDIGAETRVCLDGFGSETFVAEVAKIHPRAEVRDGANVFVAEVVLPNKDERLRPGMKGNAKVVAGSKSLGWILFHRAWEQIVTLL